jgi:hypothetical protein
MTASEQYAATQWAIATKMAKLQAKLEAHAAKQSKDPGNYGYCGDLGRIESLIDEALGENQ